MQLIKAHPGRKGYEFFSKRDFNIFDHKTNFFNRLKYEDALQEYQKAANSTDNILQESQAHYNIGLAFASAMIWSMLGSLGPPTRASPVSLSAGRVQ